MSIGFVAPVLVRWSDIDMYQHINHATMVTIMEEARVQFLREAFEVDINTIGLLIAEVQVAYKAQLRLTDSPLQVTIWTKQLRTVDFTLGYEVRSVNADPDFQARCHRRVTAGHRPHRGAATGAAFATPSGVSAAVDTVAERGVSAGPRIQGCPPQRPGHLRRSCAAAR